MRTSTSSTDSYRIFLCVENTFAACYSVDLVHRNLLQIIQICKARRSEYQVSTPVQTQTIKFHLITSLLSLNIFFQKSSQEMGNQVLCVVTLSDVLLASQDQSTVR